MCIAVVCLLIIVVVFITYFWISESKHLEPSLIEPNFESITYVGTKAVNAVGGRIKRGWLVEGLKEKWSESNLSEQEIEQYAKGYYVLPIQSMETSPLDLDEWGLASVGRTNGQLDYAAVRINAIYTSEEALRLIDSLQGRYRNHYADTEFVVVEYMTTESYTEAYLDARLLGIDGNPLVVDGKQYAQRTYDMLDGEVEELDIHSMPVYSNRYIYFELPMKCDCYLLSFGWRIPRSQGMMQTANWLIGVK